MSVITFNLGDDVYIGETGESGTISSLYPEVNTAIVKTDNGLTKAKITDLYKVLCSSEDVIVTKRKSLLDRIKSVFTKSYD